MALQREAIVRMLVELRRRDGLTQEQAADKIGVTVRQWQRWEAGESIPYTRNLELLGRTFGVDVAELFCDREHVQPDNPDLKTIIERLDTLSEQIRKLQEALEHMGPLAARHARERRSAPPDPRRGEHTLPSDRGPILDQSEQHKAP